MVNYKEAKNKIFRNKVKSWMAFVGLGVLAVIALVTGLINKGVNKAKDYCDDLSQSYADEAQQIKDEAEVQKAKDNQKFSKGLKKQKEREAVESDVESDLEDETFVELSI